MAIASGENVDPSSKTVRTFSLAVLLLLVTAPPAFAAKSSRRGDAERILHGGFYLAAGVNRVAVGGDFDGNDALVGGGSMEIIPDVSAGEGWGAAFGWRKVNPQNGFFGDLEIGFQRSDHDATWAGFDLPEKVEFESWYIDARIGRGSRRIYGFGLLGLGGASLRVPEGSTDGFVLADATFEGGSIRAGAGLLVALHSRLALTLQAIYRFDRYDSVEAIVSGDLADELDGNGMAFSASMSVVLGKPR